jgi:hypothetical protein
LNTGKAVHGLAKSGAYFLGYTLRITLKTAQGLALNVAVQPSRCKGRSAQA